MVPAETSTTGWGNTHDLRESLRALHQVIRSKDDPQAGEPSPTSKGGKMVLCPRFFAVFRHGDVAIVKMLLEAGADVTARNRGKGLFGIGVPRPGSGLTPLGVALEKGHHEVADLLRQHGAKE